MTKTFKFHIVCIILFIFTHSLSAQSEREIKTSGNYHWGEAFGDSSNIEQLKKAAKEDLISKISSLVTLSSDLHQEENADTYTENFAVSTRTISRLQLLGVNYIGPIKRLDRFRLIAYISIENYKKSLNNLFNEIRQTVKIAEQNEREQGLSGAAIDYYFAYLKCSYSPDPIEYISSTSQSKINDLRPFLKDKLKKYLSGISLESLSPIKEPETQNQVFIPIIAKYNSKLISNVSIQIDEDDLSEYPVINGSAKLLLNQLPMQRSEILPVRICLKITKVGMSLELQELAEVNIICEERNLEIDYTTMIKIDFSVLQDGTSFKFNPLTENLSVTDMKWDFGDGSTSNESNPLHEFAEHGFYDVTLTMNRQENLKVSKVVAYREAVRDVDITDTTPLPPIAEKDMLDKLLDSKSFPNLITNLKIYKSRGKLVFGKKHDFPNPETCYVFIINPKNKEIEAALTPGNYQRSNLLNHEIITDISLTYKKMVSIWVKFYN